MSGSEPTVQSLTRGERKTIDAEIDRLRSLLASDTPDDAAGPPIQNYTNLLVYSTIALAVLAVAAIVTIFLARPNNDNTAIVATIIGFLVPLMTGLLAGALQQIHMAVNSRLTQLLRMTAAKSRAEGVALQQEKDIDAGVNPSIA